MTPENKLRKLEAENSRLKAELEKYRTENRASEAGKMTTDNAIVIEQLEEALRTSEQKFDVSFNTSPGLMVISKLDDATYIDVNDSWCTLTGYSREEMIGRTAVELGIISSKFWKGIINELKSNGIIDHRDFKITTKHNEVKEVIFSAEIIDISGSACIFYAGLDVTRRKKAEAELVRAHELLKSITDGTDDMIAAQDNNFRFIFFNEAYKRLFRKLWGTLIEKGTSMVEAMAPWPVEQKKAKMLWSRALQGESFKIILEFGSEGEEHFYDLRYNPLRDATGKIFGAAHIMRDVTEQIQIQKALHDSESRFRQLAESMPQLIFVSRPDGYHEYFNQRWYDFTGASFGETHGDLWSSHLHPDDYIRTMEVWKHSLKTGDPYSIEYRLKRGDDGSYHWFLGRAMPVRNENGEITRWLGTCTDIQELKNTQQALQESQERYQLVNQATFDIIWDWNLLTNQIEWNEVVEEAIGRTREELPDSSQGLMEHIHPEDRGRVFSSIYHAINSGQESWISEYRFGLAGGPWRVYLDRAFIARAKDGRAYRMIGTMLDLTDRKEAEEAVKKSEKLLQNVLEVLPVGVFLADEKGNISQTNSAAEKIWEGTRHLSKDRFQEYRGWWRNTGKRIRSGEWAFARAFTQGETSVNEEIDIECFDGTKKTILNSATPVRNDQGEIVSAVAVVMDVTGQVKAVDALRESEERFRTLADNMSQLAWMADEKGNRFWYNKRWYDFTGKSYEEMKDKGWKKLIHPDHRERVIAGLQNSRETGEAWEDIYPVCSRDGNYRWFLSRVVPVRDEAGTIIRWFGTNTDVTEQRKSKELLGRERELLQTIIDGIPVMITIFGSDLKDFRPNRAFEEITGWTGNEDKHIVELLFPDPQYREEVTGYMLSLEPGFRDIVMTTKDDRAIETIWANVKLHDDRRVGIGIDISERKQMEDKLREQALMLDQVQDAIVALDDRGHISYMNNTAYEMYEIERDSGVVGTKIGEYYIVQWDHMFTEEDMYKILDKIGIWKGENIHVTAKGKSLWVDSVVSAIKDAAGNITGIISSMRDISGRKKLEHKLQVKAEEQKKASELFENLLYITAHDLKGPIANMFLALNLIDRVEDADKKSETMEIFRPLVSRLENTIKGLTGILQVQKTDESAAGNVNFESIINEIMHDHRDTLYEGTLQYDFSEKPDVCYIEPFLSSIMKNLINNAIKYSRDNVPLKIEVKTTRAENGYTLLTIKDNGIGMDMEKHGEQLFTPFKRISPSKAEGTGVGLYIIKNIIEKNGGYIEVKSTPGEGTEFYCYLREYATP